MKYRVEPGLYALNDPSRESPVFVSANYKLSFDILRRRLGRDGAWILVLDTKGINVWCAAGKGTFGTRELIERIIAVQLDQVVSTRDLILPQLGAPGVSAHVVRKSTGFRVIYGPVRAEEIPAFLQNGMKAEHTMRQVRFSLIDRLVLTPMELNTALAKSWLFVVGVLVFFGLTAEGVLFREALVHGSAYLLLGFLAIVAGAFLTPILLPWIPFRAFSLKGALVGVIPVALLHTAGPTAALEDPLVLASAYLVFPTLSSYLSFNFTGCTTFTSVSGVKRELRLALPIYLTALTISGVLLIVYKLRFLGVM